MVHPLRHDSVTKALRFLAGEDAAYVTAWSGIYTSLALLMITVVYMAWLGPRRTLDKCYLWVLFAMTLVLGRVIYNSHVESTPVWWGSLIWLHLTVAAGTTLVVLVRSAFPMVRR